MTQKEIIVSMLVQGELLTSETFCTKISNTDAKLNQKIKELQTEGIRVKKDIMEKDGKNISFYVLSKSKTSQEALNKYLNPKNP